VGNSVHRFSKRTAWQLEPSEFSEQIAAARSSGRNLIDLTVSNPTVCGFEYDWGVILGALKAPAAMVYDPDPRGMKRAREAVAHYYSDHGAVVAADAIVLTTSTSEAYSYLFRLLCDAGDEVLVAQPSYPLFEFLADLDDVRLTPYPLFYDFGWWIDFAELERRIGPRTRAVLVVHPNNPTGHWTHRAERQRLEALCERHGLALIVDEVFLDYQTPPAAGNVASPKSEAAGESFASGPHPALTFVLSGISKIAALPQMKVAWLAAFGPEAAVREALARLEVIADTFLSMNAPAQLALPHWLARRGGLQRQILARVKTNLALLRQTGLDVLEVSAGWAAVVRLRHGETSFETAKLLLAEADVIVHPGSFYGFPDHRMIVVSLIVREEVFRRGVSRIADFLPAIAPRVTPERER
jgi:aspartate/methionine/tyrosine aminotransferase